MAHVEWIHFEELCNRATNMSASTLRRAIANKQITARQRVAKGKLSFNWAVVSKELALLDNKGPLGELASFENEDISGERFARLELLMGAIAGKLGIDQSALFAGEQRKAG